MSGSAGSARKPASQSLRRIDRLSRTDDFSSVFALRGSVRSEHFQLLYRPTGLGFARFGVVVAKKLGRRAVDRNLVKRLAREAFRTIRVELPTYDLVLRLSSVLARLQKPAVRAEIDDLLRRLRE